MASGAEGIGFGVDMERTELRPSRSAVAAQAVLIVAALHFAHGLFLPLAKGAERLRLGRIPSNVIVVLSALVVHNRIDLPP